MDPQRLTPAQKAEYRFFYDAVRQLDWDLRSDLWAEGRIPRDWRDLIEDEGRPGKERVTLRLDADLVKFFRRKWGRGYQAEVNLVLRAFFKLHMSRMVKGEAGFEALLAEAQRTPRPRIGEAERELGGDGVFGGLGEG
jgi:hypothetical protein